MSDGFELRVSGYTDFRERLMAFSEEVVTKTSLKALSHTAKIIQKAAIENAHDSTKFIQDVINMPESVKYKRFWFITDDAKHLLKEDNVYVEKTSGNLKKNIRYARIRNTEPGTLGYRIYIHNKVAWYAKFVEFGRSGMAPRPFMRPAYESHLDDLVNIFEKYIQDAIDEGNLNG